MKSDLDRMMRERGYVAVLVLGNADHNPAMHYFTGGGHVRDAVLIKRAGAAPVLYCNSMERDEAAKSGLRIAPLRKSPMNELAIRPREILTGEGIASGRVAVYGTANVSTTLHLVDRIREELPDISIVGEALESGLLLHVMETKDATEVSRIRAMGKITTEVVGMAADYLTSRPVDPEEVLLDEGGAPLTIRKMKSLIERWVLERGASLPDGFILSIGRDAGVPHSVGEPEDVFRLGRTIILDLFPAEDGGGYFYDFTRTWSLGYADPEAQGLYDEVRRAYARVVENLDLNAAFTEYNRMVCDEFHAGGHKTPLHSEGVLLDGYVHSLGHGVGLNIHERPFSSPTSSPNNRIKPGVVFTIEPGLYYPEKQMGVRIEDTYWMSPEGKAEVLAEYPYDFVLPMKSKRAVRAARPKPRRREKK